MLPLGKSGRTGLVALGRTAYLVEPRSCGRLCCQYPGQARAVAKVKRACGTESSAHVGDGLIYLIC